MNNDLNNDTKKNILKKYSSIIYNFIMKDNRLIIHLFLVNILTNLWDSKNLFTMQLVKNIIITIFAIIIYDLGYAFFVNNSILF